jgi:hypothetical protein
MSAPGAGRSSQLTARLAGLGACAVLALSIALVGLAGGAGRLVSPSAGGVFPVAPTGVAPAGLAPTGPGELSVAQIGELAVGAGFRGQGLVMAIAVALAESRGNPAATNDDSNGTVDRGLWQINSVHSQFSPACDYDPACNAAAAFSVSDSGTDWEPWVTWRQGAEIAYLPEAAAFVAARPQRPTTTTTAQGR